MKKLLILMAFSILLLTGCNVEYNLDIDENLNFNESILAKMTSGDNISVVQRKFDLKKEYLDSNNYDSKYIEDKITIENNFKNYSEYLEHSDFYSQYFENLVITEKNDLIYIQTVGNFYKYVINPTYDKYHIEETKINIKLPFKVVSNNADEIDEENGIYTWIVTDKTSSKKIELVFDKNKKEFRILPKDIFMLVGIFMLLIVIGIIIFMRQRFKNNEL